MSRFEVGDKVTMPGVPFVVEVLEIQPCEDNVGADVCDREVFRFSDPGGCQGDDWAHADEFEKVG